MKNCLIISVFIMIAINGFTQRFERLTSGQPTQFKRHFTYSIEGGYVDNLPRHFIGGNESDWLTNPSGAQVVQGNSIVGTNILPGGARQVTSGKILLTDFVVPQQENNLYAYATGIYYPENENYFGYVFFATYERSTMVPISAIYYDLLYPATVEKKRNTAGTRIKYSKRENAYYISGIMADQVFVDLNFNDIQGSTQGFILKIDPLSLQANVLVIESDALPDGNPEICSVNDLVIDTDESFLYFTGVTSKAGFPGYSHPVVGKADLNLNLLWCNAYEMPNSRFSGIDVELGEPEQSMFVLMNSETYPFSIMELDLSGRVLQDPELYEFKIGDCIAPTAEMYPGAARGHKMHFTEEGGLIVTGNCFIQLGHIFKQHLFSYKIPMASNLSQGDDFFSSYSCDEKPLGAQIDVTSWWAPENSLYENKKLAIVGHCDYDIDEKGYVYILLDNYNTSSIECYQTGGVQMKRLSTRELEQKHYFTQSIKKGDIFVFDPTWSQEVLISCIANGPVDKSTPLQEELEISEFFHFKSIDNSGIHACLNSEELVRYQVNVFDIIGKNIYSAVYDVKGKMDIHLKFLAGNQLYLISVNNGKTTQNIKVSGVK